MSLRPRKSNVHGFVISVWRSSDESLINRYISYLIVLLYLLILITKTVFSSLLSPLASSSSLLLISFRRLEYKVFLFYFAKEVILVQWNLYRRQKSLVKDQLPSLLDTQQRGNLTLQYICPDVSSEGETQLSEQFVLITNLTHFLMCLFHFSTCFEQPSVHHQENQLYQYIIWYTECPRRNVPDFGRVFLMLKYTDINQNTYV